MADFRALCVELLDCLEKADWPHKQKHVFEQWVYIARAALAEPDEPAVPAPPADAEVAELVAWLEEEADDYTCIGCEDPAARCALAAELLQRQVPVPVPVSERLPGPEDCDAEGLCWAWNFTAYTWGMFRLDLTAHSHWLPAHALPIPSAEVDE